MLRFFSILTGKRADCISRLFCAIVFLRAARIFFAINVNISSHSEVFTEETYSATDPELSVMLLQESGVSASVFVSRDSRSASISE